MKTAFLGVYILFLAIIWWFFLVAKIHSYKFKTFSNHIESVTKALFFVLLGLSIIWFVLIYAMDPDSVSIDMSNTETKREYY